MFEVLLPEVCHELTECALIGGVGLDLIAGAEFGVAAVAGGI